MGGGADAGTRGAGGGRFQLGDPLVGPGAFGRGRARLQVPPIEEHRLGILTEQPMTLGDVEEEHGILDGHERFLELLQRLAVTADLEQPLPLLEVLARLLHRRLPPGRSGGCGRAGARGLRGGRCHPGGACEQQDPERNPGAWCGPHRRRMIGMFRSLPQGRRRPAAQPESTQSCGRGSTVSGGRERPAPSRTSGGSGGGAGHS